MTKRSLWIVVLSLTMILLAACSGGGGDSSESSTGDGDSSSSSSGGDAKSLRAASSYPTTDRSIGAFGQPLLEFIGEESDEVKFELFTGGELVETEDDLESLSSGTIDVAMALSPTLDPERFPYSGVISLPLLESNGHIAAEAVKNLVESDVEIADGKTFYQLEFEDKDLKAFPVHPTETYLISTGKQKLESVDDFAKSVRIRVSSSVHETLVTQLGLTPQSLPATEIYDAMSRGALDGALFSVPDWPSYGIDEASNFAISGLSLGHFPMFLTMNQSTWDSFSDDTQSLFEDKAAELIKSAPELYAQDVEEILGAFEERGADLVELSTMDQAVQDKIDEALLNTWNVWIEDMEDRGFAGKEIALLWRDLVVDAGGVVPEEVMDLE